MAFHLSREDKRDLSVVGGLIAIIVFILLFHTRNTASPSNYVTPEMGGTGGGNTTNIAAPAFPGLDLPQFPGYTPAPNLTPNTANSQCGCGCADDPTQQYLNTAQLENDYLTKNTAVYDDYIRQLEAAIPTSIAQYVNNEKGYFAAITSQNELSTL